LFYNLEDLKPFDLIAVDLAELKQYLSLK